MRLISIGSSSQAQIVLNSQYVSGYHAELLQLDNGDMLLVDKGSRNGTFVNGTRITPEKEVSVTYNDKITFADQVLNWSLVPALQVPDKENIKVLKSVGSHYLNTIHISGNQVSRFHATIKQTKDGKWYICDHSTNGTMVNGTRIPKDQYVRLKKGDTITCAGVIVPNPATNQGADGGNVIKKVALAVCVCLLIGLCAYGVMKFINPGLDEKTKKELYTQYASTTALLHTTYYFKITTPKYNTERFIITENGIEKYDGTNAMHGLATGFFISNDGVLVTALHVTSPWLFGDEKDMLEFIKTLYHDYAGIAVSDIKVEGAIENIVAYPNGKFFDETNAIKLRIVTQSNNTDIDLSILQTMNGHLPAESNYIPIDKIQHETKLVGTDVLTMGFPYPMLLQDLSSFEKNLTNVLQATVASGEITQIIDKYKYGFNANSYHGASGSPIFDKDGYLVGVVSAGIPAQGYNFCINAKYIKRLLNAYQE